MRVVQIVLCLGLTAAAAASDVGELDTPLHWLGRDGWLYVGIRGAGHLSRRAGRMSVFTSKPATEALIAAAETFGRYAARAYFGGFKLKDAELSALTAGIEQVHVLVGGWEYRVANEKEYFLTSLAVRYKNPAAASKVFASRAGKSELDTLPSIGDTAVYRMEGFDDQARYVAFHGQWMLCMLDRARLEAILAGKKPPGESLADHPLLARARKPGEPVFPIHADFGLLYDTRAHLAQVRSNLLNRRTVAAKHAGEARSGWGYFGEPAEWDRQIAAHDAMLKAFALDGLRGAVLMSQLTPRGDGGTVIDVSLDPSSPWLGLTKQRIGVGRLLALLPGDATLAAVSNSSRPTALLRTTGMLSPMLAGPTAEAVGFVLREGGEPLRELFTGFVTDAAVAEMPRKGEDARSDAVLLLGLNDLKAAKGAIGKLIRALRSGGGRVPRVVRSTRYAGAEIQLLSEAGVEGTDAALLAWTQVSDVLVVGSLAGVRHVVASRKAGRTMSSSISIAGELGRTPGKASQLLMLRPAAWARRFRLGPSECFAEDFPVLLKLAPTKGGVRLRSNISLGALASTWGVVALQILLLGAR